MLLRGGEARLLGVSLCLSSLTGERTRDCELSGGPVLRGGDLLAPRLFLGGEALLAGWFLGGDGALVVLSADGAWRLGDGRLLV